MARIGYRGSYWDRQFQWPVYRRMAARGVSGHATVVELHPKFYCTVRYRFDVGEAYVMRLSPRRPWANSSKF
jgi:hypothetical protein